MFNPDKRIAVQPFKCDAWILRSPVIREYRSVHDVHSDDMGRLVSANQTHLLEGRQSVFWLFVGRLEMSVQV
jgi:hypothetical protein